LSINNEPDAIFIMTATRTLTWLLLLLDGQFYVGGSAENDGHETARHEIDALKLPDMK